MKVQVCGTQLCESRCVGFRCKIAGVKVQLWESRYGDPGVGFQVWESRCVGSGVDCSSSRPGPPVADPGGWESCVAAGGTNPAAPWPVLS